MSRHVWEGWTVQDFIDAIEPDFNRIMENAHAFQRPFMDNADLKRWCASEQPYYKKHIPEVYTYFKKKADEYKRANPVY